ncbi:type II secretion system (T2SS) protein F [Geodermatophilus tzadiensis]|uniref:Type II secretion system (T2SS) protein F n=1 Tax=Geodermatophilus tzadiensis TaxID=1137988 RepID=A0A2T0TBX1_9ACTN|nr:type II secretion system F family protein [Geodermatophilus tzadiensis]PRY43162.1 type II secretion system (T2SS) protein F [Geodermatophilus tzadiensis]
MSGPAALAALLLAGALLAWPSSTARLAARVRSLSGPPVRPRAAGPPGPPPAGVRRVLLPAAAGLAAALLLGGAAGAVAGAAVAVLADRLLQRGPREDDGEAELVGELPVACDLLAVCLGAGLPVAGALAAVAPVLPGPLGDALAAVAGRLRLGAAPRVAWGAAPGRLAGLGRVLVRAGESGAAAVPALRVLAAEARAAARSRTEAGVRRAGVWVLAPLGLCFLPAFVCLGVAPLVIGIAGQVFG